MTFVPLTDVQRKGVRITADAAEYTALAIGPQGYGSDHATVVWRKVGCIFLGWYVAPQMPSYGYVPPRFPAYLVQVLGDPVKGWPNINVEAVVIDAGTGERDTIYGSSDAPIMGTTCGVTP